VSELAAYGRADVAPARISAARLSLPLYAAVAAGAEAVVAYVDVTLGLVFEGVLLCALLLHYVTAIHRLPRDPFARSPAERLLDALPALALLPLLRILSLSVPVEGASVITWNAMVGAPLLLAAVLTMRALELPRHEVGLGLVSWPGQLQIALAGIPLGLSAYVILRPDEAAAVGSAGWVAGFPVLIVFAGLALELVFRGLIQSCLADVFGRSAIVLSSVLFAATFLGSDSAGYALFMGLVGGVFGWSFQRTGSIVGISLAHGLLYVGLLLVWPAILG
jgi:uncharacterized protein